MSASIPQAEHDRTVSHVNKDHAEDLSLYLRHFNGVSIQDATDAELVSLDLERMLIRAGPSRTLHKVAYSPPLTDWADRRAVLVEMSRSAARATDKTGGGDASGLPDPDLSLANPADLIRLPALIPDLAVDAVMAFFIASAAAAHLGYIAPGTSLWSNPLLARFPGGPAGFAWITKAIVGSLLAIHVAEVAVLATRLRKFGVPLFSSAGLFWSYTIFIEGAFGFSRFNKMIKEKKLEAAEKNGKKN